MNGLVMLWMVFASSEVTSCTMCCGFMLLDRGYFLCWKYNLVVHCMLLFQHFFKKKFACFLSAWNFSKLYWKLFVCVLFHCFSMAVLISLCHSLHSHLYDSKNAKLQKRCSFPQACCNLFHFACLILKAGLNWICPHDECY